MAPMQPRQRVYLSDDPNIILKGKNLAHADPVDGLGICKNDTYCRAVRSRIRGVSIVWRDIVEQIWLSGDHRPQ